MKTCPLLIGLTASFLIISGLAHGGEATLTLDLGGEVTLGLVRVQAGFFQQGSPITESGREAHETLHPVKISAAFLLGKYPVTVAQFERFVKETGHRTEAEDGSSGGYGWDGSKLVQARQYHWRNPGFPQSGSHPVTLVTWFDAKQFCLWLSRKARMQVELPTEAQWEYACRAGDSAPWHGGQVDAVAWHKGNAGGGTHPVGQLKPNAWGLYDMGGNAWEWCQDWYGPYPAGQVSDPVQSEVPPGEKGRRVLRGGSFLKAGADCRSAERYRNDPRSRNADNGFRIMSRNVDGPPKVMSVPVEAPAGAAAATTQSAGPSRRPLPAAPVNPSPPPLRPKSHSMAPSIPGVALVVGIVALVIGVLSRLFLSGSPKPDRQGGGGPVMEPTSTGFWVRWAVPQGTLIHWSCQCGGQRLEGKTPYQPGPRGQFIVTGQPPSSISVSSMGAVIGSTAAGIDASPSMFAADDRRREREREEEADRHRRTSMLSHRNPSAY